MSSLGLFQVVILLIACMQCFGQTPSVCMHKTPTPSSFRFPYDYCAQELGTSGIPGSLGGRAYCCNLEFQDNSGPRPICPGCPNNNVLVGGICGSGCCFNSVNLNTCRYWRDCGLVVPHFCDAGCTSYSWSKGRLDCPGVSNTPGIPPVQPTASPVSLSPTPTFMPTLAECLEPKRDTCTFYANCLESRKSCGSSGCEEIRSSAIATHAPCYVKSGACSLNPKDWAKVLVLLNKDLFTAGVRKQFFDTTAGCIVQYRDMFASVTLRFVQALEDVKEGVQELYQGRGYATESEKDHIASFSKEQVILPGLADTIEVDPSLIVVQHVYAGSTIVVVRILDAVLLTTSGSNSSNVTLGLLSNSSTVISADAMGQLLVDTLLTEYSSDANLTLASITLCTQGNSSCEESINGCQNVTCQNGGTCVQTANLSSCSCPIGSTGSSCEDAATAAPSSTASVCEGVYLIAALLSTAVVLILNVL